MAIPVTTRGAPTREEFRGTVLPETAMAIPVTTRGAVTPVAKETTIRERGMAIPAAIREAATRAAIQETAIPETAMAIPAAIRAAATRAAIQETAIPETATAIPAAIRAAATRAMETLVAAIPAAIPETPAKVTPERVIQAMIDMAKASQTTTVPAIRIATATPTTKAVGTNQQARQAIRATPAILAILMASRTMASTSLRNTPPRDS